MIGEKAGAPAARARRAARHESLWERVFDAGAGCLGDQDLIGLVIADAPRHVRARDMGGEVLARFGSLADLGAALPQELVGHGRLSVRAAARVVASAELGQRCLLCALGERPAILGPPDVARLVRAVVGGAMHESFHVLLLDSGHRVIGHEEVTRGTLASCLVDARGIFRLAVRRAAAAIILAHNHPSGDPTPSPEDFQVTWRLAEAGRILGIDVLDHVVVGRAAEGHADDHVSLRELGAFAADMPGPLVVRSRHARPGSRPDGPTPPTDGAAQTCAGSS